jgi:hypothetical protein
MCVFTMRKKPNENSRAKQDGKSFFILVTIVVGVVVTYLVVRLFMSYLSGSVDYKRSSFSLLIFASGAGFFPISAIAYNTYCVKLRRARLEEGQKQLQDRYGTLGDRYEDIQNPFSYFLHVSLATLVSIIGISLLVIPELKVGIIANEDTLTAMRYGFLGAYAFSFLLIYRRSTTFDLQPPVYMNCALILIAGLIFNYVAFEAIRTIKADDASISGVGAGLSAILAFSLGYFPNFAPQWFNRVASAALGGSQRRADALPLGLIDGVSELHEVRLRDNGIDNVSNLASAEIHDLVINTNFNLQQVVDWVDQALLYSHLEPSEIDNFRRTGIRTLSDFQSLWKNLCVDPDDPASDQKTDDRRREIANQLLTTPERLDLLYKATENGPNILYVKDFFKTSPSGDQAETLPEGSDKLSQKRTDVDDEPNWVDSDSF